MIYEPPSIRYISTGEYGCVREGCACEGSIDQDTHFAEWTVAERCSGRQGAKKFVRDVRIL